MRRLKILHIGNGNAFKIRAIISFFRDRGHEIHFIPTINPENRWEGIVYHYFKPVSRFNKFHFINKISNIRKIVKEIRPDIIHAHNARGPGWWGAFCGHHPFILHAYGGDVLPFRYKKTDLIHKILTMYTFWKVDKVIVTAKHMVKASSHLHISEGKITVLPRGVDINKYKMGLDVSFLRSEIDIKTSSPIIFSPRYQIHENFYNFDTIIESIPIVKKNHPNVLFIQLYDKSKVEKKQELKKIARDLGVSENYKLVEAINNEKMPYFYNLADIVISMPSTDGFPVTVLESAACGVPMVVTKLDYTSEWFRDNENGLLIPVRDHQALATSVLRLLDDKILRQRMIEVNRKKVEEVANYEKCMSKLEDIYYELIKCSHLGT